MSRRITIRVSDDMYDLLNKLRDLINAGVITYRGYVVRCNSISDVVRLCIAFTLDKAAKSLYDLVEEEVRPLQKRNKGRT
mgnify:CR=1 FL=1